MTRGPRRDIRLILNPLGLTHVSEDTVAELERAILAASGVRPVYGHRLLARALGAAVWRRYERDAARAATHPRPLCALRGRHEYVAVLMGLRFRKCLPFFAAARRRHLYLFDAWPQWHPAIRQFVRAFRVDTLFVSSSQVSARLDPIDACRVHWVPEGIDPRAYAAAPYTDRDIDVLEFGRRHDPYHRAITGPLAADGRVHLYEERPGQLVFRDRAAFVGGLAQAKISVCFPSNLTHPERAADVETMTIRYLQSMAAKCLVVGHAPAEMVSLFGYNPVIEVDPHDPAGQLRHLLRCHADHVPRIERNYEEVRARHTWAHRWGAMQAVLGAEHSAVPPGGRPTPVGVADR